MRKIVFLIIVIIFTASYAQIHIGSCPQSPEVWHRPDSLIIMPTEDSIAWTEEYTAFAVVRSLNADSTAECLWSFAESDTLSCAVLTKGVYSASAGVLETHNPHDFSKWRVYAYRGGIHADSTKQRTFRLGEQIIHPNDSIPADTLHARIEMEEIAYFNGYVLKRVSGAFQTYLAVKYGITLDYAAYLSPVGDTLWHPVKDRDYYNHVIGVGNDTTHQWNSLVSHSKEDAILHIMADTLAPNEYILMGDDNGAMEWQADLDGTSSIQRTWRIRQQVNQPHNITIALPLSELEGPADSLWLNVLDANEVTLLSIPPTDIVKDSICYFALGRTDTLMHFQLQGLVPDPLQVREENPNRLQIGTNTNADIWYNPSDKTIVVDGFPNDQIFTLYLYDNSGKYLSSLSTINPIDIAMLPNAVFYIEITADNRIVGAIPVPIMNN